MTAPARGLSACHNHTQMSDGALALDDMVRAAVRQGFSDIGISDHSCLAAEPPHATGDEAGYLAALRGAKARFAGQICVAAGLELDALSHFSARHELDYVIGSVHYLYDKAADRFYGVDWDEATAQSCIKEMFGQNGLAYAKAYYAAVAENALRTRPDVIGHFDLVVKPNARGALFDEESPAYRAAALEALDACCEAGGHSGGEHGRRVPRLAQHVLPRAVPAAPRGGKGHARHRQRRRPLRRGAVFRLCTRARDAAAGRLFQRVGAARRRLLRRGAVRQGAPPGAQNALRKHAGGVMMKKETARAALCPAGQGMHAAGLKRSWKRHVKHLARYEPLAHQPGRFHCRYRN